MMNYEEMSDLRLNLLVATAIGVDAAENEGVVFGAVKHEGVNVVSVMGVVDYCNNPSDAWPIIVENKLSIVPTGGWWRARPEKSAWPEQFDDNPLRAAMIVFLREQDAQ